jgi:hypothetical protein
MMGAGKAFLAILWKRAEKSSTLFFDHRQLAAVSMTAVVTAHAEKPRTATFSSTREWQICDYPRIAVRNDHTRSYGERADQVIRGAHSALAIARASPAGVRFRTRKPYSVRS